MENELQTTTYELAYHLTPDLEESDVVSHAQEISNAIAQNGGTVVSSQEPKKIHLSYPIDHKDYGYFGLFDFTSGADTIEKLNAQMKLQNNLLRFILIKKAPEGKDFKTLTVGRSAAKTKPRTAHKPLSSSSKQQENVQSSDKDAEKVEPKEMDQEIEKVIEGL
ncbi:MAG: 30S ribosomal protein S6 [Candidatus Paceibacterota bacterium]